MTNQITWHKPDPPPNALHTAFTHLKAVEGNPASASSYTALTHVTKDRPSAPSDRRVPRTVAPLSPSASTEIYAGNDKNFLPRPFYS
jgi:hypothetical protein